MKTNNQTAEKRTGASNSTSLKAGMGYRLNQAASSKNPDTQFISSWFSQQRHESFKYAKSLVK